MRLRPFFLLSVLVFGVGAARGSHAGVAAAATPVVLGEAPLVIEYHMPGIALRALEDGDTFRIDAGLPLSGAPGRPVLPVIPAMIALPAGTTLDQVQVVPEDYSQLSGSYRIEHGARPFVPIPGAAPTLTAPDDAIYGSDAPYPGKRYEVVGVQHRRGVALLLVNLYPVEYHPRSGRIAFWQRLNVRVTTRPDPTPSGVRYRPDPMRPLADAVDNPQILATYTGAGRRGGPRAGLCDPADTFQYVFITSRDIRDAAVAPNAHELIAHRESRGMTATIVVMEDILADYPGWDTAEQLRNFIIDAYNNWDTDFVVLGGDTNVVPMRRLWAEVPVDGAADHLPSDLYFQCLENGNYNENWNDKWGESNDGLGVTDVDLLADVYIGRISAEDAGEMANAIHKILAYENDDHDEAYKRRVLMCGERLGWTGLMAWGGNFMEELHLGSTNYGYTTVGFTHAPRFTVDTLYDKDAPWDKFDMEARINADQYGIINHLGHCMWYYSLRLYRPDIDQLVNNRFPFAYSQGCWPGAFDYDCAAEHYTTSTRHGLVACVMNSRYGLDPGDAGYGLNSLDGPSQRFHREFWNGYLGPAGLRCLGVLNAFSHDANAWTVNNPSCLRWSYYESNLLGDPATPLPHAYALRDGLCFDQDDYFTDTRAGVTLHNAGAGPEATQTVTLTTSGGDSETLVLHLAGSATNTFTNDILIAYGDPAPDNGVIEGTNHTIIIATWPHPVSGVLTARAVIAVDLYVDITNMPSVLPRDETTFVVAGCNNGHVAVAMTVSNQANGAAAAFTGTNQWTAPPIALTDGVNPIRVAGVNLYGEQADDEVIITRVGPAGATHYVAPDGAHVWPFISWATAATTIQAAVDAAYDSNTVLVADGLYLEDEIVVDRPMHLASVAGAQATVIDGQDLHRCLRIGSEGIVEGFTFRNGYADYGGGAHVVNGDLRGCVLSSNRVDLHGGGVYIGFSGLVEDSRLQGNQAQKGGGAKCDYGGAMTDCDVVGNTALDSGGGLNCHRGGIIVGCRIANNVAQGQFFDFESELAGGGVFAGGPGPVFSNCLITGNSAPTVEGGGVCCGATVMDRCMIIDNRAGHRGGGVSLKLGAELRDCLIARNVSSNHGGGAWCRAGSRLENCTLSGNRVTGPDGQGGGVFLHDGGAFVNC
ncbi:MAG: hypothetical protein EOM20_06505, partial [Spartobacteria bacterium]|nr:hypothetical protein [Spartobacteria bacterium]